MRRWSCSRAHYSRCPPLWWREPDHRGRVDQPQTRQLRRPPKSGKDERANSKSTSATAEIDHFDSVPLGVTHPKRAFFKPGGLVASVAWKVLPPGRPAGYWESYKSEIAAYELDKLLDHGHGPGRCREALEG